MQNTSIIGHIGQDAEIGEAGNGNTVINFNVAVTEKWTNKQGEKQSKTTWYKCAWWLNNTTIAQYLKKGTQVYVSGKSQCNAYQNKQGEIMAQEGINVRSLELLGGNPQQQSQQPQDKSKPVQREPYKNGNEEEKDDLPF